MLEKNQGPNHGVEVLRDTVLFARFVHDVGAIE